MLPFTWLHSFFYHYSFISCCSSFSISLWVNSHLFFHFNSPFLSLLFYRSFLSLLFHSSFLSMLFRRFFLSLLFHSSFFSLLFHCFFFSLLFHRSFLSLLFHRSFLSLLFHRSFLSLLFHHSFWSLLFHNSFLSLCSYSLPCVCLIQVMSSALNFYIPVVDSFLFPIHLHFSFFLSFTIHSHTFLLYSSTVLQCIVK